LSSHNGLNAITVIPTAAGRFFLRSFLSAPYEVREPRRDLNLTQKRRERRWLDFLTSF
jgi:hypothetical protein